MPGKYEPTSIAGAVRKNERSFLNNTAIAGTRVESLDTSPFICRIVPEQKKLLDKNLREILLGNYRIVYHIDADVVNILTVFHAKRDFNVDRDVKT